MKPKDKPLEFADRAAWRAWLEQHHAQETSAWLRIAKRKTVAHGLTLADAVEEALCFGWIDGLLNPSDAGTYLLRFSPRKGRSVWSEINKRRALKLMRQGRMAAAGLAKIAAAKANGEWGAATAREDTARVPTALEQALRKQPRVWRSFQAWPPSRKKQYLYWLESAKTEATRLKRIQAIIEKARETADG